MRLNDFNDLFHVKCLICLLHYKFTTRLLVLIPIYLLSLCIAIQTRITKNFENKELFSYSGDISNLLKYVAPVSTESGTTKYRNMFVY